MTDAAANDLVIGLFLLAMTVVLSAIGFLWARWMTRQETRIDRNEDRVDKVVSDQAEVSKTSATRDELASLRSHIDDRFDRLEDRFLRDTKS